MPSKTITHQMHGKLGVRLSTANLQSHSFFTDNPRIWIAMTKQIQKTLNELTEAEYAGHKAY